MASVITLFTLPAPFLESSIYENNCEKYTLETLYKSGFDLIYSLITTLLRFDNLKNKKSCQIAYAFFTNKENRSHFLEDNCFCQIICKYTSIITSQKMKALVAYKLIYLPISKINVKLLGKFDAISIT